MRKNITAISFLLFIAFLTILPGCLDLPSDLVMPKWDVDINAPLINKTYSLHDIIKQQNYIYEDYSNNPQGIYLIQSDTISQGVSSTDFINTGQTISFTNYSVPPADGSQDFYIPYKTDNVEIQSAHLQSGTLELAIRNNSNVDITFSIIIPSLTKNQTVFQIAAAVSAGNSADITSYLDNYEYNAPSNQDSLHKNDLLIEVTTQTTGIPNLLTTIGFDVYLSNLNFNSVTGKFPKTSLGNHKAMINLNLGDAQDFQDKTFLKSTALNFTANYASPYSNNFILEFDSLTIIGHRSNGDTFALRDSTGNKYFDIKIGNGNNRVEFTNGNSNIADFIAFLPDQVSIQANYFLDGQNLTSTVSTSDSVNVKGEFSAESFLALKKTSLTDTTSIDLSDDDRSNISNGRQLNMNMQIDNGIPLTTWLYATFTDVNYKPLFTLKNNTTGIDSIYFLGADVDQNGEVSNDVTTTDNITLDSSEVSLFAKSKYIIYTVSLRTRDAYQNPPPIVAIRPSAQLRLKAYGQVKYNLNPSDK